MTRSAAEGPSPRAQALADELRTTAAALVAAIRQIEPERWSQVDKPGEWSPGKDAEHAADAVGLHLWRVRHALGMRQSAPPVIERARLTAVASQTEVIARLQTCAETGAGLIERLTDAQLDLPSKPAQRPPRTVGDIVARPLIAHLATHQREIEVKLRIKPRA